MEEPQYVSMMACDVAGYSKRPSVEQAKIKQRLSDVLMSSLPSGAEVFGWNDAGDGGVFLLTGGAAAAAKTVEKFKELLEQHPDQKTDPISLRYALHAGPVRKQVLATGEQFSGDELNTVHRLLDAMPRKPEGLIVATQSYASTLESEYGLGIGEFVPLRDAIVKHNVVIQNSAFVPPSPFNVRPYFFQETPARFQRLEFQEWLMTEPGAYSGALATRTALRAVPIMAEELPKGADVSADNQEVRIFRSFRALFTAWFEQMSGHDDVSWQVVKRFATSLPQTKPTYHAAARAALMATVYDEGDERSIPALAYKAANAAFVLDVKTAPLVINDECRRLYYSKDGVEDTVQALLSEPLWNAGPPEAVDLQWAKLRDRLLMRDPSWKFWIDWYDDRLSGAKVHGDLQRARFEALVAYNPDPQKSAAVHECNAELDLKVNERSMRDRSPTDRSLVVDPTSGEIRATMPRLSPTLENEPVPTVIFETSARPLSRAIDRLLRPEHDQQFGALWPSLRDLQEELSEDVDIRVTPQTWLLEFDVIRETISEKQKSGALEEAQSSQLSRLLGQMAETEDRIREAFPDAARAQDARRAQNIERLTEEELTAVQHSIDAFSDIIDDELKDHLLENAEPIENSDDRMLDPRLEGVLSQRQRARLYRLRAAMLRIRELARLPSTKLRELFDLTVNATKKIESYRKASEAMEQYWTILRDWFLGG